MPIEIIEATRKIDILVIILATLCFLIGNLIILYPTIKQLLFEYKVKLSEQREFKKAKKRESDFDKDLRYMLSTIGKGKISANIFKYTTVGLFFVTMFLTVRTVSLFMSVVLASVIALIPYVLLKMKLSNIRNAASTEAESLISDLMIQYRIAGFVIEEGLEKVITKNKDIVKTKPLLYNMLQTMRSTRNKQEIKDAVDMFSYTVGTNWAKMLSHNIYSATVYNINISMSLQDILVQLREARMLTEERKRINAESVRLLWLIPISYLGTAVAASFTSDMPFLKFIENQFSSVIGVVFFIIIIALTVVCYVLISITKKQRFDF